jgi:putative ABC transport system permease protein
VISLQSADRGEAGLFRIMMIGADVKSPGQVSPAEGRAVRGPHEAVVDRRLSLEVGQVFALGGRRFKVVGVVDGLTVLGGVPDVWISLPAAQSVLFGGRRLVTTIAVQGEPEALPAGLTSMSSAAVVKESLGPMKDAVVSVNNTRYLMWGVAVIIVAALVYVSALQRTRDFAVMKAVGASSRLLFVGVATQAVLVTLGAALFAVSTAWIFRPLYKVPVEVPGTAYLVLLVVAVGVGVASSLVALRRAVNVDPALAFGSA